MMRKLPIALIAIAAIAGVTVGAIVQIRSNDRQRVLEVEISELTSETAALRDSLDSAGNASEVADEALSERDSIALERDELADEIESLRSIRESLMDQNDQLTEERNALARVREVDESESHAILKILGSGDMSTVLADAADGDRLVRRTAEVVSCRGLNGCDDLDTFYWGNTTLDCRNAECKITGPWIVGQGVVTSSTADGWSSSVAISGPATCDDVDVDGTLTATIIGTDWKVFSDGTLELDSVNMNMVFDYPRANCNYTRIELEVELK